MSKRLFCYDYYLPLLVGILLTFKMAYAEPTSEQEVGSEQIELQNLAKEKMMILSATYHLLFNLQDTINSPSADKSTLFGENFLNQLKIKFEKLHGTEFPPIDHPYKKQLINVIIKVLENNRALILDKYISNKGFIPVVFTSQIASALSNMGLPLSLKWIAPNNSSISPFSKANESEIKQLAIMELNGSTKMVQVVEDDQPTFVNIVVVFLSYFFL
ncbi:hypothetical protein [Agaribacter flavus]|uniref:Uncharacterized protein n=1 Tax=Agaribacter flavus TaxID=1902781 RepID=A0ABV7FR37_9ALTE